MKIEVVTLFPRMIAATLEFGVVGRAIGRGLLRVGTEDPRAHTSDVHRTVDDRPYGGGPGMVLKPEPMLAAIRAAHARLPPGSPRWGKDFKAAIAQNFTRTMEVFCHGTSLPVENNSFSLDPDLKDAWGLPALRLTYKDHPDDLKLSNWLFERALAIHENAGAVKRWSFPAQEQQFGVHLLGTCRMGTDPKSSVINPDHRTHDVKNLFLCDGSSLVTSGRGQPTMTIMALAFRAADRITALAKRGELGA